MPVGTYSAGMKQRVAFAINMSMTFDYYLFDEIGAGGDKRVPQDRQGDGPGAPARRRNSSSPRTAPTNCSTLCDSGIVIQDGDSDLLRRHQGRPRQPMARMTKRPIATSAAPNAAPARVNLLTVRKARSNPVPRLMLLTPSARPSATSAVSGASPETRTETRPKRQSPAPKPHPPSLQPHRLKLPHLMRLWSKSLQVRTPIATPAAPGGVKKSASPASASARQPRQRRWRKLRPRTLFHRRVTNQWSKLRSIRRISRLGHRRRSASAAKT